MAREAVEDLEAQFGPIDGKRIADLGCGPGFFTRSLREAGAEVVPIDNSIDEASLQGDPPPGFVLADAGDLPFPDGDFDGIYCSNLLEHTPNSPAVLREIARTLKPGGWAYISWTNWYSPWGGHAISPWHYLGTRLGPTLYEKRYGGPHYKNAYGDGLWAVHIGRTLRLLRADPRVQIIRVEPRYWPGLRAIMRVPGAREVLAWNCVIWLRRAPGR
jgi:SAM-dependent methyltransferase